VRSRQRLPLFESVTQLPKHNPRTVDIVLGGVHLAWNVSESTWADCLIFWAAMIERVGNRAAVCSRFVSKCGTAEAAMEVTPGSMAAARRQ